MKITSFLLPLFAAAYVSAHGSVSRVLINGKVFNGNRPGGNKGPSIIRQVSSQNPNQGASNPALTCGPNASAGSLVADANPGDTISFDWRGWPHNTGPMLTYMASCGSTSCDKFNAANARWFKIHQVGRKANSAQWAQADLMTGGVASLQIPRTLAPGNYLIRHEIIALHLATSRGGAEFYPSCAQLRVGGNQSGKPNANELVSLPGAYKDSDPGIFAPNVFNSRVNYVFPGPAIASFVSGAASPAGSGSSPKPTTTAAAPAKTTSKPTVTPAVPAKSTSNASSKGCQTKKRREAVDVDDLEVEADSDEDYEEVIVRRRRPRHASRIMRRMAFEQSLH